MSDKRSVSTDALQTLGTIITEGGRDAIHLAVEPCVAGEKLYPGQDIGILDGVATTKAAKMLGIVDPFIKGFVPQGAMFWLVVYPRQITSLRHVWSHPDFEEKKIEAEPTDPVEKSKLWIRNFADLIRQHPDSLMVAANNWVEGEDYTYDNSESYKDHWDMFPEFWHQYKIVTGSEPKDKSSFFTCSC